MKLASSTSSQSVASSQRHCSLDCITSNATINVLGLRNENYSLVGLDPLARFQPNPSLTPVKFEIHTGINPVCAIL